MDAKKKPDWIGFTVPGTPPSVNHYVKHTRTGKHYKSREAMEFMDDVARVCVARKIKGMIWKNYEVHILVYLGEGQKGDIDNFSKCALDSIVSAGVIVSDCRVTVLVMRKLRDAANPRTEFKIFAC